MNDNAKKKVSIIIPAFNEEKYISGCLDSILNLDYPEEAIEVIVVDNGSTDRTREISTSYGVTVLCDDTRNVSGLRNLGVVRSSGDIVAFVDADCTVTKNWLSNASIYFNNKEVVAWGSPPVIPENPTWVQKTWFLMRDKKDSVTNVDWLETMNLFTRRDHFLSIGGFNEALVTCEDVDFSYRVRKLGKIVSDNRIKVVHHGEAATIKEFIRKEIWRGQGNLKGILSHGFMLKELPSLLIPFYFGVLLPGMLFLLIFFSNMKLLVAAALIYMLPSATVILKVRKHMTSAEFLRLLFLIQVYFFSRTLAMFIKT